MNPVAQRIADALARRAAAAPAGPLRERLLAAQARWASCDAMTLPVPARAQPGPGPLAALVAQLGPARAEPLPLQANRREWAALRLERRLAEPVQPVAPAAQIGPLNPQALVPRALQQLKTLSPDYLQRLLVQVDTLAQLAPLAASPAPRKPGGRKR